MIVLFTDFGLAGPYIGQVKAVLALLAVDHTVIDLQHDAPAWHPKGAAYLLSPLIDVFSSNCIFLCVVDPGVGGKRAPGVLKVGERWFVGPDNGLFEIVLRRALARGEEARWWDITWRPDDLSTSFHGRDIFAPIAARLANGQGPDRGDSDGFMAREISTIRRESWSDDLYQVIYIDGFGNATTGIRTALLNKKATVVVNGQKMSYAETYSSVMEGDFFWYGNSCGLAEISVNRGRAADILQLETGMIVSIGR